MSTPSLSPKETAVVIRRVLRTAFPATKFSVRTERGSMVSSVRVSWTDGPTVARVDAVVGCFEAGHFDGMTDSYEYDRDRHLIVDGTHYRPGCRYVSTSRTISPALANRCIRQVAEYWRGIDEPLPVAVASRFGGDGFEIADGRGRNAVRADLRDDWYTMVH
ncbi:MAG: LPD29 domain-containing protein, partial [bacterium]